MSKIISSLFLFFLLLNAHSIEIKKILPSKGFIELWSDNNSQTNAKKRFLKEAKYYFDIKDNYGAKIDLSYELIETIYQAKNLFPSLSSLSEEDVLKKLIKEMEK